MAMLTAVPEDLADRFPTDPVEQRQVLELGLRELSIRRALAAYREGHGSLAFAARQAGISLREMIPLAYAHGIEPRLGAEPADDQPLTLEQATNL